LTQIIGLTPFPESSIGKELVGKELLWSGSRLVYLAR
jgi:hypothetical protein